MRIADLAPRGTDVGMTNQPLSMQWEGESGATYTYHIWPFGQSFNPGQPGNYIISRAHVEDGRAVHEPIYIGETSVGFRERFAAHEHAKCFVDQGATNMLVRTNSSKTAREAEETDLLRRWSPPCND